MPAHTEKERKKKMTHEEVMVRVLEALDALIEDRRVFNWQQEEQSDRPGVRVRTFTVGTSAPVVPQLGETSGLIGREELTVIVETNGVEIGFAATREEAAEDLRRVNVGELSELGRFVTVRWPHGVPLFMEADTAGTIVKTIETTRGAR